MDFLKEIGYLAFGSRARRLADRLLQGGSRAYKSASIDFEPRWFALFYLLYTVDAPMSIIAVAEALKMSHPAVIQTARDLVRKKLVKSYQNSADRRKRHLVITDEGRARAKFLLPVWDDFVAATLELMKSAGTDLLEAIDKIEMKLDEEDLEERIVRRIKARQYQAVEVVEFKPEYRDYFKTLNAEWLREFFHIEETDRKYLQNPEDHILARGGAVFFARLEGTVIGTAALLRIDEQTYELTKMAVAREARGRQAGRKLADTAIAWARIRGAKSIVLWTDNRLRAAVGLYGRLGFKHWPGPAIPERSYERMKFAVLMKLDLHERKSVLLNDRRAVPRDRQERR